MPTLTAAVAAAALLLTGCSADDGEDPSPEPIEPTTQETPTADAENGIDEAAAPVTVTETFLVGNLDRDEITLEAQVGPIVRDGDLAALPMEFAYLEGDSTLTTASILHGLVGVTDSSHAGGQVRLVDAEQMTVTELAQTGRMIAADGSRFKSPGETLSWLGFFDAPQSDQTAVLLPHFGLIPNVPVIEGNLAEVEVGDDSLRTFADYDGVTGQTHQLITWRETPHYSVDIEGEETTVRLPSDVLFDVDSAELSDEAEQALQAAVAEMEGTAGGELSIIGHTDNVLDESYNQTLSEQRAGAVRERLAARSDKAVAVLFIDLDGFKAVNDLHGHAAGDDVLKETAERLRSCLRKEDTLARMGGDELVVVLEDVSDVTRPLDTARRVLDVMSTPFDIGESHMTISASIGVAMATSGPYRALLQAADEAMYAAKARGPGQVAVASVPIEQTNGATTKAGP